MYDNLIRSRSIALGLNAALLVGALLLALEEGIPQDGYVLLFALMVAVPLVNGALLLRRAYLDEEPYAFDWDEATSEAALLAEQADRALALERRLSALEAREGRWLQALGETDTLDTEAAVQA